MVTLDYMGRSNPWGDDQMWRVGRYGGSNCVVFGDCRLRGVGVVGGVSLPSPIYLRCRPYNWSHYCVHDRVIVAEWMLYGVEIVLNMERDDSFFGSGGLTFIVELNHYRS